MSFVFFSIFGCIPIYLETLYIHFKELRALPLSETEEKIAVELLDDINFDIHLSLMVCCFFIFSLNENSSMPSNLGLLFSFVGLGLDVALVCNIYTNRHIVYPTSFIVVLLYQDVLAVHIKALNTYAGWTFLFSCFSVLI